MQENMEVSYGTLLCVEESGDVGQCMTKKEPPVYSGGQEGQQHPGLCKKLLSVGSRAVMAPLYSALMRLHFD